MTKQEQIEEMAKFMCMDTSNRGECEKCGFKPHKVFEFTHQCWEYDNAETIYNAGYRKIDDDCAVITKDELKLYQRQAVKEFAEKVKMAFFYEFDEIIPSIMSDKIDELIKEFEK